MKKISLFVSIILLTFIANNLFAKYEWKSAKDKRGYEYKYVDGDHLNCRIYTLDNGLTVFLRQLKDEPRIQTYIAVRAGSTYDPKETTGLAHYLEHMMFKGSSKIGSADWEKEKPILDEISRMFELHKATNDPQEKKRIYKIIDSLSQLAAQYAIPSEYDKMVAGIGAKGTNAYTSTERTVYINNIPANELERWLVIESERFRELVLRLFHTELETVYEEFNMYQDEDAARVEEVFNAAMFQKHPYGTQTVIGKPEHLKNPSMVNIHNYFNNFYVPNNMAISLSGDLDFEETITLIDKYFGKLKKGNTPTIVHPKEDPITKPIIREVYGPQPEFIVLGYRLMGYNDPELLKAFLLDRILYNGKAGLIDLNLVKSQKVLDASSYLDKNIDYSVHSITASPREGQSLEELRDLILQEIEKIKKGEFDDWLLEAVINNLKLSIMRSEETNAIAHNFVISFTMKQDWREYYTMIDNLQKISKRDIIEFANKYYNDNYVCVFKRIGKDTNIVKVEKPEITPVKMNREAQSEFYKQVMSMNSKQLQTVFLDYEKDIKRLKLKNGIEFNYIDNPINDYFQLSFILDMGKNNDLKTELAVNLLPYLGTNKYSPEDLSKEFYKLGINLSVSVFDNRTYVAISGLKQNLERGLELLEHTLANAKPDDIIYSDYVDGILKSRNDAKLDKNSILWDAMYSYAMYDGLSPFTNILSEKQLRSIKCKELTDILKNLLSYKHYIFYYGKDATNAQKIVEKIHKIDAKKLKDYPQEIKYKEREINNNMVYVVDYDMVQANVLFMSKDCKFDKNLIPYSRIFNEYFGGGLSSIVFQEIRESRALAYSAFSAYTLPRRADRSHYVFGFVGTQPDKLRIATDALVSLLNDMPKAQAQFEKSKEGVMKKIESERITKASIFWNYLNYKDLGINYDIRKDIYEKMKVLDLNELEKFFNKHIKNKSYVFLILANKNALDYDVLKQLGEVKELSLEEIFAY